MECIWPSLYGSRKPKWRQLKKSISLYEIPGVFDVALCDCGTFLRFVVGHIHGKLIISVQMWAIVNISNHAKCPQKRNWKILSFRSSVCVCRPEFIIIITVQIFPHGAWPIVCPIDVYRYCHCASYTHKNNRIEMSLSWVRTREKQRKIHRITDIC